MNIELELRLEGQDANEEILLDLMDWLGRADIDGLTVKRKELPPVEGDMSYMLDLFAITVTLGVGILPAYLAAQELKRSKEQKPLELQEIEQLVRSILDWQEARDQNTSVVVKPKNSDIEDIREQVQFVLKYPDTKPEDIQKQIQSVLKYMETKSRKGK